MFESTAPPTSAWWQELNAEQRRAAAHGADALLILAGAGTGKTTTLVSRVAWLMGEGVDASRILLLTFTRRAAREMIQRARTLTEHTAGPPVRIVGGTFHSVGHHIVRRHAGTLGLNAGFGLLDASDAADLLDLVREERGHARAATRFPRKQTLLDIYSRAVNAQAPLSDVVAECFPWCETHRVALAELFREYGQRKRALGVLDLDDLLVFWRALGRDPVIGRRLAADFDHVLVDEYQDVNGLQVDIVKSLVESSDVLRVTAVGDDFQAIYGFRSASARHILDFPRDFPAADTVTLERNYRSTGPILAVANAVAAQDRTGFPKRLCTDRTGGEVPELVLPRDESEQAVAVSERVLEVRDQGVDLRCQAVLFRTGHDSALLEIELTRRQIPFVKYGGLRYLEAAHIKDFVALLRLADNHADEMSWFRVLQLLDGVGPARARRALDALRSDDPVVTGLQRWPEASVHLPAGAAAHGRALVDALEADGDRPAAPGPRAEALRVAIEPILRLRYPDAGVRLLDLDQLVQAAAAARDLGRFVSDLVLDPPASSADWAGPPHLDEDYLVLSTVHSAKGLEWDTVHLIGAYDGNFPADMSAGSAEGVAEERRLFYVALTRAKRRLHVYAPVRYHHRPAGRDDAHGYGRASRFLTQDVQSLMSISRRHEPDQLVADVRPGARVEVSLDALFR